MCYGLETEASSSSLRCPILPVGVRERGSDDWRLMGILHVLSSFCKGDYLLASDLITFQSRLSAALLRARFLRLSHIVTTSHPVNGKVMWLERV